MRKLILILIILSLSCSQKAQNKTKLTTLKIPVTQLEQVMMSDFVSDYKITKLEFTDQSVLSAIKKIITYKGYIYVLDPFGAKSLLVFNIDGKFVKKICSQGKGPSKSG